MFAVLVNLTLLSTIKKDFDVENTCLDSTFFDAITASNKYWVVMFAKFLVLLFQLYSGVGGRGALALKLFNHLYNIFFLSIYTYIYLSI